MSLNTSLLEYALQKNENCVSNNNPHNNWHGISEIPHKNVSKKFSIFSRTYTPSGVFNDIIDIKSGNIEKNYTKI